MVRIMSLNCWNIESHHTRGGTLGSHTLTSKSKNDATLTFSTEASKNDYVWQEVKMGLLVMPPIG